MKVKFDALLRKLGCPDVGSLDKVYPCPKCHNKKPSMRISYSSSSTFFVCAKCDMCLDAINFTALCLKTTTGNVTGLFEPGGRLHDTLAAGHTESWLTDYISGANSQAIMQDLRNTARVRISDTSRSHARSSLEKRGVRGGDTPADTGSVMGVTITRLVGAGVLSRPRGSKPLKDSKEYVTHFTRYANAISGCYVRRVDRDEPYKRVDVKGAPDPGSPDVYAASSSTAAAAETVYVLSSPEEVCRFQSRRAIYTSKPAPVISTEAFPLPPEYCRVRSIVLVTDGTEEGYRLVTRLAASPLLVSAAETQPVLRVNDCRGVYDVRNIRNFFLHSIPGMQWFANHLIRTAAIGGLDEAAGILRRFPDRDRIASRLEKYIPAGPGFEALRRKLFEDAIPPQDCVDAQAAGHFYRTADGVYAFPAHRDALPVHVAGFRIDILKRMYVPGSQAPGKRRVLARFSFPSGNKYERYFNVASFSTWSGLRKAIGDGIHHVDRPVYYNPDPRYTPGRILLLFDPDAETSEEPRSVGLQNGWVELPNIRISAKGGKVEPQLRDTALARMSCLQGPNYNNYRESDKGFRRLWKSERVGDAALSLCISHAVFCALVDIASERAHAYHVPARLTVVDSGGTVWQNVARAICTVLNGGPNAYTSATCLRQLSGSYRTLPVVMALEPGKTHPYRTSTALPTILFADPVSAARASSMDNPVFLTGENCDCENPGIAKRSWLQHLSASFPYLLACMIRHTAGMTPAVLSGQRMPALYMYRVIASAMGFEMSETAPQLISTTCDSSGYNPVDMFFSALQSLCYGSSIVKIFDGEDVPYHEATICSPYVQIRDDYVVVSRGLYGHIARHCMERYKWAPSQRYLTACLVDTIYYYTISDRSHWHITRQAWESRVKLSTSAGSAEIPKLRFA